MTHPRGSESLVSLIQRAQKLNAGDAQELKPRAAAADSSTSSSTSTSTSSSSGSKSTASSNAAEVDRVVSAASFFVPALPAASSSNLILAPMYSGHLPAAYSLDANSRDVMPSDAVSDAHLFFLLVKAKHIADRQKLVIWFNGGPGCSSFDGALLEIGPVTVQGKGEQATLRDNPGKWNEYANVLFVDQPAGTGYSYINKGTPVRELAPAADQVVTFLSNFYSVFPEYKNMDTYLAGESYAGMTIPYLARAMAASKTLPDTLKGLLMGNGWFSPVHQYPGYVEYAKERGFLKKSNSKEVKDVMKTLQGCQRDLNSTAGQHHVLVGSCERLVDGVMKAARTTFDNKKYCINEYDVRPSTFCGEFPPGLQYATPYLQQEDVLDSFHASRKSAKWQQCNNTVGEQMWSPRSYPSVELFPELLEKMPILLFAGDADLMCNWVGIEKMLDELSWRGATGFGKNVTKKDWFVNGTLAGSWKEDRNLTWVIVKEAGHMVPIDKPYEAHDILLRFTGIDSLNAAGAGSKVPSTVGQGNGGVLGKISPDGETLDSVKTELEKQAAAVDKAASDAVDKAGEEGQPIDKERELLYGPRRSAVLFLIILAVSLAVYALLRWRARLRHRRQGWSGKHAHLENKHFGVAKSESGYRLSKLTSPPPSSTYYGRRARQLSSEGNNSPRSARWTPAAKELDRTFPPKRTKKDSIDETARALFAIEDEEDLDEEERATSSFSPAHGSNLGTNTGTARHG